MHTKFGLSASNENTSADAKHIRESRSNVKTDHRNVSDRYMLDWLDVDGIQWVVMNLRGR
jgi:hypothetical protein